MAALKSWKFVVGFVLSLCLVGFIYFGYYFCSGPNCALRKGNYIPTFTSNYDAYASGKFLQNSFSEHELNKDYTVDLDNQDVIVFLHIQKTGGSSFGKHLVDLEVQPPCNCYKKKKLHCDCVTKKKQVWLFSRFSTGWSCGLHADWTELTSCVDDFFRRKYGSKKRNYHYITMLRDPVRRFISEWMHVRRGATWKMAALKCNGKEATLEQVPFCYSGKDWKDVTLQEFLDCRHNLAFNRQTRMLANLSVVNCYDHSALSPARRDALLLTSAKQNLLHLAFFGLTEFQVFSQFLFEHTLNLNFLHDFEQQNITHSNSVGVSADDMKRIVELNRLDIELYQFAKDLFLQRVKNAYVEEGLPESQDLETLIAAQGMRQEGGSAKGGYAEYLQQELQNLQDSEDAKKSDNRQQVLDNALQKLSHRLSDRSKAKTSHEDVKQSS